MGNIVHGKWDQNIPDKNGALSLEFFRNETFIYSKVQEDETEEIFSGTWEIVEADFTIELKFDEFDPNIKQVLASDGSIYKVFP